ncbi:hypothetical protein B296_00018416 [Ensete ventricosum]|uniref:beta-galactosidase n=1 Tax=Ensete ventricosum TaxID=4639 RepID=A0A427B3I5_ENSVE|nr:hypothetical protein B296_00018416 [Ensete ventricosum]
MGVEPILLRRGRGLSPLLLLAVAAAVVWRLSPVYASVSYDRKAVIINGQRRILFSGSIHYPRSTPEVRIPLLQEMWLLAAFLFVSLPEAPIFVPRIVYRSEFCMIFLDLWQYYFGGNYDLVRFVKLVKQAGLYVHLRIGPYVCAEWNFG